MLVTRARCASFFFLSFLVGAGDGAGVGGAGDGAGVGGVTDMVAVVTLFFIHGIWRRREIKVHF